MKISYGTKKYSMQSRERNTFTISLQQIRTQNLSPQKIDTFWHNWIIKITLDTSDLLGLSVGCIERPWAADCGQMEKL